jgi:hypothetical protein
MLPYPFGDVMLDTCPTHGTWFDHDEIARVVKAARQRTKASASGNANESTLGEDVWATAKFTVGMVVMPLALVAKTLGILAWDVSEAVRDPRDDEKDDFL